MATNYGEMKLADLYVEAKRLGVEGHKQMKKAELVKALKVHVKKHGEPPETTPEIPPPADSPPEPKPVAPEAPAEIPVTVRNEVTSPRAEPMVIPEPVKAEGGVDSYIVVKGGRFVKDSQMTNLPRGAVLTRLTHNLDQVKAQGIEMQLLEDAVSTGKGQLGQPLTLIGGIPVSQYLEQLDG